MQTDVVFTGIGGQGVQLAARAVCLGAMRTGHHVRLTTEIGGEMRGGISSTMIAVSTDPLPSMPLVVAASVAVMLHPKYWNLTEPRMRSDAVVLANSTLCAGTDFGAAREVVNVPATDLAMQSGAPMTVGLVLAGAFVALTGLVPLEEVEQAMVESLPEYRKQHIPANRAALHAGAAAVKSVRAEASA